MPTLQQQAAKMTREAVEALFRTARAVPADKRDWSPMGAARTVQSQLIECALVPLFFASLLRGEPMDLRDEATQKRRQEAEAALTTLEAAEAAATRNYAKLCSVIEAVPDSQIETTHQMPWGMTAATADLLFFAYWNLTYHIGQINYLQTMLGDTEMH